MSVLGGPSLSRGAAEALDSELMTRLLAPRLGVRVVRARVVATAPGRRAVVAYDTAGCEHFGISTSLGVNPSNLATSSRFFASRSVCNLDKDWDFA